MINQKMLTAVALKSVVLKLAVLKKDGNHDDSTGIYSI